MISTYNQYAKLLRSYFTFFSCTKSLNPGVYFWLPLVAQIVKNLPTMQKTWVQSLYF